MRIRPANSRPRATADHGFIVVAVLWILGGLAALLSIYAVFVVDTANALGAHDDRLRSEALVSAAVELTAYRMTAATVSRPTHGQFSFRMGKSNVEVDFRSEAARVDLNAAPKETLAGLFATLGASRDAADSYAKRVIGWRTPPASDPDPEASAYRAAGLRYAPRGGRFPHVNELSLVLDLPAAVVEQALPFVTVYSGRPQVNIFDAAPEVIAALPGMTVARLNSVLAQRRATPGNRELLLSLLGPAKDYATSEGSKATRVNVRIAFDNGRQTGAEVVILMFDQGSEPYSVLSWRDEWEQLPSDDRGWKRRQ
jgi:general secretion pathway protein K